ncbi:Gfo/Idh/MocA family oxidoreductase [bacterium]|nr:Gfo/Idh/MocA family oxidoreductase [bacterium]
MDKVKLVFVGVGSMGQCAHLKNYVLVPQCEVVAIAELREKLGKEVARRYNIPKVYRDYKEMFDREEFDGIVAIQPFTRHGIIIPELLEAKVPIFIEKPLASSVEVGEKIVEATKKSGTWIMVGYHKRSDPATVYTMSKIEEFKKSMEIGRVKYIRITMPPGDWIAGGFNELIKTDEPYPSLEYDPPSRDMDEKTYKRYVDFVNYYIHQVNLLRYLLGEPYRVKYADPSGVIMAVESEGGIPGIIEMSPYRTTIDWQESVLVAFEYGYIKLSLSAPLTYNRAGRVEIFKDPGDGKTPETIVPQLPWIHAMYNQAVNFVRAIKGEIKPPCDVEEALEDLKIAKDYIMLLKTL